jgi:tetratricopeptide (TPR) repeat protein
VPDLPERGSYASSIGVSGASSRRRARRAPVSAAGNASSRLCIPDRGAPHDVQGASIDDRSTPQAGHAPIGTIIPLSNARAICRLPHETWDERAMSKRLDFLLALTSSGKGDSFAWYGLAMEYRSLSRIDEAIATFEKLRARAPDYLPMYLMCGQALAQAGRLDEAREWLSAGVGVAQSARNDHSRSELEGALAALG